MNKQVFHHIKRFLDIVLRDPNGISGDAFSELSTLMQTDRDFALEMHDVMDRVAISDDRFKITEESDSFINQLEAK
jgi:hypothetical protein